MLEVIRAGVRRYEAIRTAVQLSRPSSTFMMEEIGGRLHPFVHMLAFTSPAVAVSEAGPSIRPRQRWSCALILGARHVLP